MDSSPLVRELEVLLAADPVDLARMGLAIARVESPHLDADRTLGELTRLGRRAADHLRPFATAPLLERLLEFNRVLYDLEGFHGNVARYDDLRNSLLDQVVARRTGIPITLGVVYLTVARAAGLDLSGVPFPGHFLLRAPRLPGQTGQAPLVIDPFNGGRLLGSADLHGLLAAHAGPDAVWSDALLEPCSARQIVVRMLNNLKRLYVTLRSFRQAWHVTNALVSIGGPDPEDVRDRGLLAYHLDQFVPALEDLETYVRVSATPHEESNQRSQIWEHITALRRRVASLN